MRETPLALKDPDQIELVEDPAAAAAVDVAPLFNEWAELSARLEVKSTQTASRSIKEELAHATCYQ